jgi:hypothetical protein
VKEKQLDIFGNAGTVESSPLGKDPDRRGTAKGARSDRATNKDLVGQRYLVPAAFALTSDCPKCHGRLIGIHLDGALVWLDAASAKPAGRNASTARLHSEVCK